MSNFLRGGYRGVTETWNVIQHEVDSIKVDSMKVDSMKVDSMKVDSMKVDSMKVDSMKAGKNTGFLLFRFNSDNFFFIQIFF